ncbi:hypothetical protein ASC93_17055 [Massilia sp. Root335]|nr:hypothetical protein ASC93_17055 [Massilia sp. Root335]
MDTEVVEIAAVRQRLADPLRLPASASPGLLAVGGIAIPCLNRSCLASLRFFSGGAKQFFHRQVQALCNRKDLLARFSQFLPMTLRDLFFDVVSQSLEFVQAVIRQIDLCHFHFLFSMDW